jgi:hypothetical protein
MTEHLKFDDRGNFVGLFTIDGHKARALYGVKNFWGGVDHIVKEYALLHPGEMNFTRMENEHTRKDNNNQYGSNASESFRHALSVPIALFNVLQDYEPTLFNNKKTLHEFMKRYPVFRACDVA